MTWRSALWWLNIRPTQESVKLVLFPFNLIILPLVYNNTMWIIASLILILLALAQAQSIPISNYLHCATADLLAQTCLKCTPEYLLIAGSCTQCSSNYTLVNNGTCVLTTSLSTPAQTPASTFNQNLNQIMLNPTLLAALQAYVLQLSGSSVVQNSPCTSFANGFCLACATPFTLANGVCVSTQSSSSTQSNVALPSGSIITSTTSTSSPSVSSNSASSISATSTSSSSSSNSASNSLSSAATTASGIASAPPGLTTGSTASSGQSSSASGSFFFPFYIGGNAVTLSTPSGVETSTSNGNGNSYTDNNCRTVNNLLGICSECYPGYFFSYPNQTCIPTNPLCRNVTSYNWCLACYDGYFLSNGNCWKSISNCKTTLNGACTACFDGYILNNTLCVLKASAPAATQEIDQFCFNFTNGTCNLCVTRYYLSPAGKCLEVDPFCQNYTSQGVCQVCYTGYRLVGFACKLLVLSDPLINAPSTSKVQCVFRTVDIRGECVKVNDLCASWSN